MVSEWVVLWAPEHVRDRHLSLLLPPETRVWCWEGLSPTPWSLSLETVRVEEVEL